MPSPPTPEPTRRLGTRSGYALLHSGKTGAILRTCTGPAINDLFGSAVRGEGEARRANFQQRSATHRGNSPLLFSKYFCIESCSFLCGWSSCVCVSLKLDKKTHNTRNR